MKKVVANICTVWLLSYSLAAQAAVIGIEPDFQDVMVGDRVDVGLRISGLGDFAAPSVGTFELSIGYDLATLSLIDVTLGDPVLGDQLALLFPSSAGFIDDPSTGVVNVFEVSLDFPSDLDRLQPASFVLASLSFQTLVAGSTSLTVDPLLAIVGDSLGAAIPITTFADGTVNVTAVPAPSSLGLLVLGLAILGLMHRRSIR